MPASMVIIRRICIFRSLEICKVVKAIMLVFAVKKIWIFIWGIALMRVWFWGWVSFIIKIIYSNFNFNMFFIENFINYLFSAYLNFSKFEGNSFVISNLFDVIVGLIFIILVLSSISTSCSLRIFTTSICKTLK